MESMQRGFRIVAGISGALAVLLLGTCAMGGGGDDGGGTPNGYSSPFQNSAEAVPAYNASSAGVYKGGLVGSSGAFQIYIGNQPGLYYALVVFDDSECAMATSYFGSGWSPGMAVSDALFSGTLSGGGWDGKSISLDFSVNGDGSDPQVTNVAVGGHAGPIEVTVAKELSDRLVVQYRGTAYYPEEPSDCIAEWFIGISFPMFTPGGDAPVIGGSVIDDYGDTWSFQSVDPEDGTSVIWNGDSFSWPETGAVFQVTATPADPSDPKIKVIGVFDTAHLVDSVHGHWYAFYGDWGVDADTENCEDRGEFASERCAAEGEPPEPPEPPVEPQPGKLTLSIAGIPTSLFANCGVTYDVWKLPLTGREFSGTAQLDASGTASVETQEVDPADYMVRCWVHLDGDPVHITDQDLYAARSPITVDGDTTVSFDDLRCIAGTIGGLPGSEGVLYVLLTQGDEADYDDVDDLEFAIGAGQTTQDYHFDATDLPEGDYDVGAFLDTNGNAEPDEGEYAGGVHPDALPGAANAAVPDTLEVSFDLFEITS